MMKRHKLAIGAGLTVFFVMFSLGVAWADSSSPALTDKAAAERAKQHFSLGEESFKAHKFEEALDQYRLGYLERPSPVFTFNMAQCHRLLGHRGPAIELYRRYLVEAPDGGGRALAEQRIAELTTEGTPDKGGDENGAATPTAPPPAIPPTPTMTAELAPPSVGAEATAPPRTTAAVSDARAPAPAAPSLEISQPPSASPLPAAKLSAPAPTPPSVSVSTRAEERETPIYRRWWFWTAAAAIATGTVLVIASSSSGRPACDPDRLCK